MNITIQKLDLFQYLLNLPGVGQRHEQNKGLFTNFFSPVRAHLCDAARWIVSATSKRSCSGVDRTGKSSSFTRGSRQGCRWAKWWWSRGCISRTQDVKKALYKISS